MERSSNLLKRYDTLKTTWCCKPRIGAIREQLKQIPEDATHVVISVGGNNATGASSTILGEPVTDCEEATDSLIAIWVFPKIVYPPIIHFNRAFHYKPSILGYPYRWKHPYPDLYPVTCSKSSEKFHTRSQQALGRLHDFAVTFEADFAAEMMLGFLKE